MTATLVAGIIGGPISGTLLSLHGLAGLAGWQWLFLLEGLPAVLLGFVVLRFLPERPDEATWLTREERDLLAARLASDAVARPDRAHTTAEVLKSGRVWLLALVYFTIPVALYGMGFWLPQIIKSESGGTDFDVGLLSAIPYVLGAVGMVLAGRHSDRTGERRWHVALAALAGGAAFASSGVVHGLAPSLLALSLAMLGLASMFGPFWTLATSSVRGVGAAAGIALINSVGNIGGFVGPYLLGYISDATHSFTIGLIFIGAVLTCGGLLVLLVREEGSG